MACDGGDRAETAAPAAELSIHAALELEHRTIIYPPGV